MEWYVRRDIYVEDRFKTFGPFYSHLDGFKAVWPVLKPSRQIVSGPGPFYNHPGPSRHTCLFTAGIYLQV